MNSNKTIRLRTTPGESQNIQFKIEQEFDTLDILSLKITQEEAYRNFCSDYGVVVGRVIANDGFGVENAKISVFIPISNEDQDNPKISSIYPYTTVNDTDSQGVRYNLLPKQGKKYTHYQTFPSGVDPNSDLYNYQTPFKGIWDSPYWILLSTNLDGTRIYSRKAKLTYGPDVPTGTFPSKQEFLDNDILLEVYEKYYKLTTKTNASGDYMLFGVPVGNQTVHMDVDLSDSGQTSLTVDDFLNAGFPSNLFNGDEFKSSTNLDSLPQIETRNISVEVVPFWGDLDQCEIGITRLDFNLNKTVTPSSILIFQAFTNKAGSGYIKNNCNVISHGMTDHVWVTISNMETLQVSVKYESINSGQPIEKRLDFSNGNVYIPVPMYEERYVTDEFGNYVLSTDQNKGVPTKGTYRFHAWGTNTHQTVENAEVDENTASYDLGDIVMRYDLKNKRRIIYTVGNLNLGNECNALDTSCSNKKWFAIRGNYTSGNQLSYPVTFKEDNGDTKFGMEQVCYGSLYFPKFSTKDSDNGFCTDLVNYTPNDGTQPYYGFEYVGLKARGPQSNGYAPLLMDITDILRLFNVFGGYHKPTSANLNFYNDIQINGLGDGYNENDINLANQTIPLKNSLLPYYSNPVFPAGLNDDSPPYQESVNTFSLIDTIDPMTTYTYSRTGRYFFYFGLYEDNNALTYLKQRLGE